MYNLEEQQMLEYVQGYLVSNQNDVSVKPNQGFRSRFNHTRRVLNRVKYLLKKENIPVEDEKALLVATIFHDVGRSTTLSNNVHGERGAKIFREYAQSMNFTQKFIDHVAFLIENHPRKELLSREDTPLDLIILQEADLLDEAGAMGIVFDCMFVGALNPSGYDEAYKSITRFSGRILMENPMRTPIAKKLWSEKQRLVQEFISQLEFDLGN